MEPIALQRLPAMVAGEPDLQHRQLDSLLAREEQIYAKYTAALAELLAAETGASPDDLEPWVVARTLIGLHQALVDYSRREIVAGTRNPTLARRVRRQAQKALELLAGGLGDYGTRSGM